MPRVYGARQRFLSTGRQRGVTLVELMVALVILAIVLAKGIPSFKDWIQNTQIRNAAESILNGLQLTQGEAVRLNAQVQFVLTASSSWTIGCVVSAVACPATLQSRSSAEGSSNAQVTATQNIITFDNLGRVTPVPATSLTFSVTNPTGGTCVAVGGSMRCLNVVVAIGGLLRMCDPVFSRTANPNPLGLPVGPQGC